MLEQVNTLISFCMLIVSILLFFATFFYALITKDQLLTNKGILETEIKKNIVEARLRIIEYIHKIPKKTNEDDKKLYEYIIESLYEDYRNAYEDACSKYEDNKIDRSRFEKMYKDSIKQLVEDKIHQNFYVEPQTKYICTLKLYKKWKEQ
jgi:hypothetical protein